MLVLGYRKPALEALERLQQPYVLVHESALKAPAGAYELARYHHRFGFRATAAQRLAMRLQPVYPQFQAVVPLGEAQVMTAAHLQANWGLKHFPLESVKACVHKAIMKQQIQAAGIACTSFLTPRDLQRQSLRSLGLPLVLKPNVGSGGRGTQVLKRRNQVPQRLDSGWLAEAFVKGQEMSIESWVYQGQVIFVNPTAYTLPRWENLVPAALPAGLWQQLQSFNQAVITALGIRYGMTHLELFLTEAGPVFGEIALRPPGGHIMELISLAYGLDAWEGYFQLFLADHAADLVLITAAIAQQFAAVRMLHPGAGTLLRVEGLEAARQVAGAQRVHCRVQPGQLIKARLGVGQEVGYLLATGPSAEAAQASLDSMKHRVKLRLEADQGSIARS